MTQFLVDYNLDIALFAIVATGFCVFVSRSVIGSAAPRQVLFSVWAFTAVLILCGALSAELLGERERGRLRGMLEGICPTYAQEMVKLGLTSITLNTAPDDPIYLRLIEAQKRWQYVNRTVNDIYTFARKPDGSIALLVDSETDYDHNGKFEGEREQRTSIGEPYEATETLLLAFNGTPEFDEVPYTDRWGTWVSAYVPVFNADGSVHSVAGVDFDAKNWTHAIAFYRASALVFFSILIVATVGGIAYVQMARADVARERRAEAELRTAWEQAQSASRAKGAFLASMSHEIRTPMNGVLGMLELMRGTELTVAQRQFVDTAFRSGESLLLLLNDILDFSKIEAGKMPLESVDFNFREMIEDIVEMHASRAHAKDIEVATLVDTNVPGTLRGDPTRLRQILNNLISNAIKFTEQGQVTIRIEVDGAVSADDVRLRITVADTGIGIPAETQKNLFNAFSQADDTISRRFGGTGLGLAISKRVATAMGGDIQLHSEVGKGSEFVVTARLKVGEQREHEWVANELLLSKRVFVVAPNPLSRQAIAQYLEDMGIDVRTAETMEAAAQELAAAARKEVHYHVALVDGLLVQGDGRGEFDIRKLGQASPATKIIATQRSGNSLARSEVESLGLNAIVNRPVRRQVLHDALCKVLGLVSEPESSEQPARDDAAVRRMECILVVEDNHVNQLVAQGYLKSLGFESDLAVDGSQALHMMANRRYDLVLMDVQMPVLDGLEATRRWRQREEPGRHLPIIAMTANTQSSDRDDCLASGMDDFLPKPVQLEKLAAMLQRYLGGAAGSVGSSGVVELAEDVTVDPMKIAELREILGTGFGRVVNVFGSEAPKRVAEMRAALDRGDRRELRRSAHSLKGSSSNIGAYRLQGLCKSLEFNSEELGEEQIVPQIDTIEVETERVIEELQRAVA